MAAILHPGGFKAWGLGMDGLQVLVLKEFRKEVHLGAPVAPQPPALVMATSPAS